MWSAFHRCDKQLSCQEDEYSQARHPCAYRSREVLLSLFLVFNVFSSIFSFRNGSAGFGLGISGVFMCSVCLCVHFVVGFCYLYVLLLVHFVGKGRT